MISFVENHLLYQFYFESKYDILIKMKVCGAIILNQDNTRVLLVKGWKSNATWGFPKGKINKGEQKSVCAVREVDEEVGVNFSNMIDDDLFVEKSVNDTIVR